MNPEPPYEIIVGRKLTSDEHLLERGHLIPYWITQDELNQVNLVPITHEKIDFNLPEEVYQLKHMLRSSISAKTQISTRTERYKNYNNK